MSDRNDYVYPERVSYEIAVGDQASYRSAADHINHYGYDVLSVQHEYGIFGGEAGAYLMHLVREAKMPIVTTLHTVLREPSQQQKEVLDELLQLSERVIVMSRKAVGFLTEVHDLPLSKIDLIPHGIPKICLEAGRAFREQLDIAGPMILTFGLLSPDKGIQYVIEALPRIVEQHPGAVYVVVGATHPHVRASGGESYREGLINLAESLGVTENIRFVDRFVAIEELVNYLGAMDIYVTPYLNPKQITSGTLAYAIGAGKAVISTPYWYAEELLDEGRGLLVPFKDSNAIADAVLQVESDPTARGHMGRQAAEFGKQMHWPEVGCSYLSSFERAQRESTERLRTIVQPTPIKMFQDEPLPAMRFEHLIDMSDDTGILQHATYTVPNRAEGYCVDDNARALLFTAFLETAGPLTPAVALLQSRYLSFVQDAYNPANNRFRNFMSYQRLWLEEAGSEDSQGRSIWALGAATHRCHDRGRREVAKSLFETGVGALYSSTSPRTWAYGILAADEYLHAFPHEYSTRVLMQTLASRLWRQFEIVQRAEWPWFEESLSYANARLPQALILAGDSLENPSMVEVGLLSLKWLMELQTGTDGVFAPIGTDGFYTRGGERSFFDQQPIEAWASMSACLRAYRITGDETWLGQAHRAFQWFLGENMIGQSLFDRASGGCHDGLHAKRINRNQGAESTLSFLCALAEMTEATERMKQKPPTKRIHEIR